MLDEGTVAELRTTFKFRYHHFKQLLNANNKSLETMAEISEALNGSRVYGMVFVRSRCTAVATSVWQIIKNLTELAPGKYELLFQQFKEIQIKINPFLQSVGYPADGPLVLPLEKVNKTMQNQVGGKLAYLSEIGNNLPISVPGGFVMTAAAYKKFLDHNDLQPEIDRLLQTVKSDKIDELIGLSNNIRQMIISATVPKDLIGSIFEHYQKLLCCSDKKQTVAMRSSALGEDMIGVSFAGQYKSILNVGHENIISTYKEIVASKYTLTAMTYRLNRGIRDSDVAMCVGCVKMIDAISGGVCYSTNPIDNDNEFVIINAAWGLPKSVVDGSTMADMFTLSRSEPHHIIEKIIAHKTRKYICYPEDGVCRLEDVDQNASLPSISEEHALKIAEIALKLEDYFGSPQDMEWAIDDDGTIFVLQSRPLFKQEDKNSVVPAEAVEPAGVSPLIQGGYTASKGVAAGQVYIVQREADTLLFPQNGVLITKQALPEWAPLLERASAVVTEMGSITGHLANIAREFDVPAILGVKDVTKTLESGQIVTIDAVHRKIYQGTIDIVMNREQKKKNLMHGSPVYEALSGASKLIVPLNLTDPYAPAFKPQHCQTFHDITRFCHEKAVHEMFHFGKDHHFPERSSKQLFYKVPMNWWVLNLDDGFKHEIIGKYVRIEELNSEPMLAIWDGIIAFPWAGPPLDGKGFMSVMFQATTNPDLAVGTKSKYTEQNYFMISKNYCSLSSRLGFHFSSIETLVSNRDAENYSNFHFKGGAADEGRKCARIRFIKELLEDYDFRVVTKDDHLQARFEQGNKELMLTKLRILGYITIHTRQLDMIMSKPRTVNYYRNKIDNDLQKIIAGSQKTVFE